MKKTETKEGWVVRLSDGRYIITALSICGITPAYSITTCKGLDRAYIYPCPNASRQHVWTDINRLRKHYYRIRVDEKMKLVKKLFKGCRVLKVVKKHTWTIELA